MLSTRIEAGLGDNAWSYTECLNYHKRMYEDLMISCDIEQVPDPSEGPDQLCARCLHNVLAFFYIVENLLLQLVAYSCDW